MRFSSGTGSISLLLHLLLEAKEDGVVSNAHADFLASLDTAETYDDMVTSAVGCFRRKPLLYSANLVQNFSTTLSARVSLADKKIRGFCV